MKNWTRLLGCYLHGKDESHFVLVLVTIRLTYIYTIQCYVDCFRYNMLSERLYRFVAMLYWTLDAIDDFAMLSWNVSTSTMLLCNFDGEK